MIQRRPPAKRAFTGLVGLPPEPDEMPKVSPPQPPSSPEPPADLTCEYRRYQDGLWICLHCRHRAEENDITAEGIPASRVCPAQNIEIENKKAIGKQLDAKFAERERRAAAARARRKAKADQLAAIKEALRTPVAIVLAEEEKQRQEKTSAARVKSVWSNHYQTGGGKELSGGDYVAAVQTAIDGKREQDFGGRRVTPQGVGHRPGMRNDIDSGTPDEDSTRDPWTKGSEEVAVANPRTPIMDGDIFKVKLNDKDEKNSPAYQSVSDYFVEMQTFQFHMRCTKCGAAQEDEAAQDDEGNYYQSPVEEGFMCWQCQAPHDGYEPSYICRLCGDISRGKNYAARHMENVHGDPALPAHDARFGNVLHRWLRGGRKGPNIEKARRKAERQVTL